MEENQKNELAVYEVGYHLLPTIPEEKVEAEAAKIKDLITQSEGAVISEDFPKLRSLAYSIQNVSGKHAKAYFGWVKFEIGRENISTIEKALKNNENILRFLVVKTVKENTLYTPKPVMSTEKHVEKPVSEDKEKVVSEEEIDKSIEELVIN